MMAAEFERGKPAPDGIHDQVFFNEYRRPQGERWVTIGQLVIGTLLAFCLVALYWGFAMLEG